MGDNEVEYKDSWCLIKMMVFNVKYVTVGFTVTVKISKSAFNIMSEKIYQKTYSGTQVQQGSRHRRRTGGSTKEPRAQSSHAIVYNAQ